MSPGHPVTLPSPSIWQWPQLHHLAPAQHRISLGEGNTPLIPSRRIGLAAGLKNLLFKLDFLNPTGSYKDRFAAAAVSQMLASGKKRCVCTSSGNAGSALAAYCAAAGIACEIAVVEGAPDEKLKQMAAYGAKITKIQGFGADDRTTREVLDWVRGQAARPDTALHISAYAFSPMGMAGVQSIAYELAQQSPAGLDHVFVPAGGGGLTLAIAKGFADIAPRNLDAPLAPSPSPAIHCVQPEGNDTMASPLRLGAAAARGVTCTTAIGGLQVPSVLDGNEVIAACRASGGTGHLVSDSAVYAMQRRLATEEGLFVEPAAAVPVVAALAAAQNRELDPASTVACILTGIAFKDMPSINRMLPTQSFPLVPLAALQDHPSP